MHKAGGRIFLQLWHMGRISHPSFQPGGGLPVAPSAITWEFAFGARRHSVLAIGNGAGCGTPPVGPTAAVSIPVIAFPLALLALRASPAQRQVQAGAPKTKFLSVTRFGSYLVLQAKQRAHCAGVAHRVAPEIIIEVDENIQLLRLPFP